MSGNSSLSLFSRNLSNPGKQPANARILKSSAGRPIYDWGIYFGMFVMVLTRGEKTDELNQNF